MLERKRGLVMVMSSASAVHPCSILPVYGSSKSYVLQLSQSLQAAYPTSETGLIFHALHPQFVQTPMTARAGVPYNRLKTYVFPDVDRWMESALKVNFYLLQILYFVFCRRLENIMVHHADGFGLSHLLNFNW